VKESVSSAAGYADSIVDDVSGTLSGINENFSDIAGHVGNIGNKLVDKGAEVAETAARALIITKLVIPYIIILTLWFVHYTILSSVMKKKLVRSLENEISIIMSEFSHRKQEFQDAFAEGLVKHLDQMNMKYFMKYKTLIETAQNQEGR
jgi:hypothetical protein